jgi:hypothetical protein
MGDIVSVLVDVCWRSDPRQVDIVKLASHTVQYFNVAKGVIPLLRQTDPFYQLKGWTIFGPNGSANTQIRCNRVVACWFQDSV